MNSKFNTFFLSFGYIAILPLVPIIIEHLALGKVGLSSLTITTAMYSITTSFSSDISSVRMYSLISALIFTGLHGTVINGSTALEGKLIICYGAFVIISLIIVVHLIERIRKHIWHGKPFKMKIL